jgi:hypothetical protein
MVGPVNSRVAPVEKAFLNVLRQYSVLARTPIPPVSNPALILSNETPHAVSWTYKFMLNAETDVFGEPFDGLDVGRLAFIYSAAETFQYPYLSNKAFNRMKYLIGTEGFLDEWSVLSTYERVPELRETLVNCVAYELTEYVAVSDTTYLGRNKGLREMIDQAVEKRLFYLKNQVDRQKHGRSGRHSQSSSGTQSKVASPAVTCYACGKVGHFRRDCPGTTTGNTTRQAWTVRTCYNCDGVGHLARDCRAPQRAPQAGTNGRRNYHRRGEAEIAEVTYNGLGIATCAHEVKPGMITRTGLRI